MDGLFSRLSIHFENAWWPWSSSASSPNDDKDAKDMVRHAVNPWTNEQSRDAKLEQMRSDARLLAMFSNALGAVSTVWIGYMVFRPSVAGAKPPPSTAMAMWWRRGVPLVAAFFVGGLGNGFHQIREVNNERIAVYTALWNHAHLGSVDGHSAQATHATSALGRSEK